MKAVTLTLEDELLERIDSLLLKKHEANKRNMWIREAIRAKLRSDNHMNDMKHTIDSHTPEDEADEFLFSELKKAYGKWARKHIRQVK